MKDIDDVLKRDFGIAADQDAEQAGARVWHRLQSAGVSAPEARLDKAHPPAMPGWRGLQFAAAAVLVLAAALGTAIVWRPADTALYRVVEGDVRQAETIRSNVGGGAVLALSDGSRVEMRSNSELAVERAADGIRIRLRNGGIIVNAAKQRTGHLYVQTNDVTVSVVGTVFLVNADTQGSRVAVIEGEVRVQQGATEDKLVPGEQLTTNRSMQSRSVKQQVDWSKDAAAHVLLLQRSAITAASQNVAPRPEAFEEVSIRPTGLSASSGQRGAGSGGHGSSRLAYASPCLWSRRDLQIDPRRFFARDVPLYQLIVWAYPIGDCDAVNASGLLAGGPEWVRLDGFDIEATMPDGTPGYTPDQLRVGDALKLQRMLQTLLTERFKLELRRELRDMPVFALTGTATLKPDVFTPAKEMTPGIMRSKETDERMGAVSTHPNRNGQITASITGTKLRISDLAFRLAELMRRPVLDRTGLAGEFNLKIEFAPTDEMRAFLNANGDAKRSFVTTPSIFAAIEEQLGLKLEPIRAPVEVLVVERVERPSSN